MNLANEPKPGGEKLAFFKKTFKKKISMFSKYYSLLGAVTPSGVQNLLLVGLRRHYVLPGIELGPAAYKDSTLPTVLPIVVLGIILKQCPPKCPVTYLKREKRGLEW